MPTRPELLVLLLPLLLMPIAGTGGHALRLALVLALLAAADAALAAPAAGASRASGSIPAALLVGCFWLGTAPLLGDGPTLALGLVLLVRGIEAQAASAPWPVRLGLAALASALVLDLALVALAHERSIVWLGLGAAVGTALAAGRLLNDGPDRAALELALAVALMLVLASYGALLAHEPSLVAAAAAGGYATVPLLALAVLRLAVLALDGPSWPGLDPLAALLLASWALAAVSLLGGG